MSLSPSRSLVLSGVLGAGLALLSLAFLDSDVSEDVWNHPQPGGVHIAVAVTLVAVHLLSAHGFVGLAHLTGLSALARRSLLVAAGGFVLLTVCEAASAFLVDEPSDGGSAMAVATGFGVATFVIAVPALIGGTAVGRRGLLPGAAWSIAASGALLLVAVTPANISGSEVLRAIALALWSLSLVWIGGGLARVAEGRSPRVPLPAPSEQR